MYHPGWQSGRALIWSAVLLTVAGCANLRLPAIDPTGQRIFLPAPSSTQLAPRAMDPATGQYRCPLLEHFTSRDDRAAVVPGTPAGTTSRSTGPAFDSPEAIPDCQHPLPNYPYTTADADPTMPPLPADPVAPRVVVPGACQDPSAAASGANRNLWGQPRSPSHPQATVSLSPRRQVAMVGSEVVLLAGVCGGDGYYVMREPIEWALSQGSVGHFVEPGQPQVGRLGLRGLFTGWLAEPLPELLSNNYALGCTSKRTQVLTRGTVVTRDDIIVQKGQAWIGVTSPVEGSTFVTAMAPNLDGWTQRTQSAVIHWVDGQWTLPPSAIVKGNQPHTLTTVVKRRVSGLPAAGFIVRYQILDATAVMEDGSTTREVVTDTNGEASITIRPVEESGGTARVQVEVIRPPRGDFLERLTIAQGVSTITWTSSELGVQVLGPERMDLNETATFQLVVRNPSSIAANDVTLRTLVPAGFEVVSSMPQPSTTGSRLDWQLGTLGPGETRTVDVTYRAAQSGTVQHCASAQGPGLTPVEDCLTTNVVTDSLYIEMLGPNPELTLPVGEEILYEVTVTNRGDRPLSDVLLADRFDPGLEHESGLSPVEWPIGSLAPGQSQQVGLRFRIAEPGRHCHTLQATATGAPPAETSACIQAEAQPSPTEANVTVHKTGPTEMVEGQQDDFYVIVENNGNAPLENLTVIDTYDAEFTPVSAEPPAGTNNRAGEIRWRISRLDPGQRASFQVTCQAEYAVSSACSTAYLRAAGGLERTDNLCLRILPAPSAAQPGKSSSLGEQDTPSLAPDRFDTPPESASPLPDAGGRPRGASPLPGSSLDGESQPGRPPRNAGATPDRSPDTGQLQLMIDSRGSRWQVGDLIEYQIVITNNRDVADNDVVLTIRLPRQVQLVNYYGDLSAASHSADWRTFRIKTIQTIRPGESIEYRVQARVLQPGQLTARAEVVSLRTPDGIAREDVSVADPAP